MRAFEGMSDDELVEIARSSGAYDTRPFEALVRRHQAFVAANCRAVTRLPNDVDDLAQEVFVKAFFGLRRFERQAPFRAWLHRIKVNHCLNYLRKMRSTPTLELDERTHEQDAAAGNRQREAVVGAQPFDRHGAIEQDEKLGAAQVTERVRLVVGGGGGDRKAVSHIERILAPLAPGAALVTILDGHPAAHSWLGAVRGQRVVPLGPDRFGQSGDIPDLYAAYGLDTDAILDACAQALLG